MNTLTLQLKLLGEKVAWTFGQQFIIVFLAGGTVSIYASARWLAAADTAAAAAVVCLITSGVTLALGLHTTGWADVARRGVLTFIQSVGGSLFVHEVAPSVIHADWKGALAVAVPVTLLAIGKAVLALRNPGTIAASTVTDPNTVQVTVKAA